MKSIVYLSYNNVFITFMDFINKSLNILSIFFTKIEDNTDDNEKTIYAEENDLNHYISQIIDKYGDGLLRLAYSYLRNVSDSEDILQDLMIKVIEQNKTFESEVHEKAWLIRVTINLCKDRIKRNQIRKYEELDENHSKGSDPDLDFVWTAVSSLPIKYKEVIHLYYQEEYSVYEISELLDKNESTVKSLLKRGREKLKMILKEDYDFDK